MENNQSIFEKHPFIASGISFAVLALGLFIIAEIGLRIFYRNPYVVNGQQATASLVQPREMTFDASLIYKGGKKGIFKINDKYEIVSGKDIDPNLPDAHFIGGSTTETAFVSQGKRWPDLIEGFNTHNHGVAGRNIIENYYNLKFFIDEGIVQKGDTVFLLQAINDLKKLLKKYRDQVEIENYEPFDLNLYAASSQIKNILSSNLYFYALIRHFTHQLKANAHSRQDKQLKEQNNSQEPKEQDSKAQELYNFLLNNTKPHVRIEELSDEEFEKYYLKLQPLLDKRKIVLKKIYELCLENDLNLVLITQPNSYLDEYEVVNGIYILPIIKDKKLSRAQARKLLDAINQQTLDFAQQNKIKFIDLNKEMLKYNPNKMFYDSVHYTEKGSVTIASIINEQLKGKDD